MLSAISTEIGHIVVNIRQRNLLYKADVYITYRDFVQRKTLQGGGFLPLQIAEEIPEIQKIFVDRSGGVRFDGQMVAQKIPQNRGGFCAIVIHNLTLMLFSMYLIEEEIEQNISRPSYRIFC